jgi:hypothetical protein
MESMMTTKSLAQALEQEEKERRAVNAALAQGHNLLSHLILPAVRHATIEHKGQQKQDQEAKEKAEAARTANRIKMKTHQAKNVLSSLSGLITKAKKLLHEAEQFHDEVSCTEEAQEAEWLNLQISMDRKKLRLCDEAAQRFVAEERALLFAAADKRAKAEEAMDRAREIQKGIDVIIGHEVWHKLSEISKSMLKAAAGRRKTCREKIRRATVLLKKLGGPSLREVIDPVGVERIQKGLEELRNRVDNAAQIQTRPNRSG